MRIVKFIELLVVATGTLMSMIKCILGIFLVVLSVCSCSKISQEQDTSEIKKYVLYLSSPETKTVNDGMSTEWVLGNMVDVLFAETGTTSYLKGADFKITDAVSGKIEGSLPEEFDPNLVYDWYICYANATPTTPKVSMPIGIWGSESFQIQDGNDSMVHLAGSQHYPLVGNVKGIPGTQCPTVKMKNVASVLAFNVRNSTENDITIQDIQLKAPELINGKFEVDFSGANILITPNKKESIARLEVQDGTPIKPGETAKFYMGVKPFSYQAGDELICVSCATSQGEILACRIAKVIDVPIRFQQGTITTLNLDFAPSTSPLAVNRADFDTFNQGIQFTRYSRNLISLDGWKMINSAANSSFIGLTHISPTLSGKSLAPGVLISPLLANGCGILQFKYGRFDSLSKQFSFRAEILDEAGMVLWTKDFTEEKPLYRQWYQFSETINIPGPFRLKFSNLCPTEATGNRDCVSLYDMSWTNME